MTPRTIQGGPESERANKRDPQHREQPDKDRQLSALRGERTTARPVTSTKGLAKIILLARPTIQVEEGQTIAVARAIR